MHRRRWPAFLRSPSFWFIAIAAIAGLALLYHEVDLETVRTHAARLNGGIAFLLLTILPLVGCPVSVLHVAAGMRFGTPLGLALVGLSVLLQLLASYGLVHWRRHFFARRFKAVREKIPPGAHLPVTVFTMLVPGVPYFAKNYTLALIGVPLRLYLGVCLPLHVAHAVVAVAFGGQSHELTLGRGLLILAYVAVLLAISWWALRRLRTKLGDRPPTADGRKRPA